MKQHEKFMRRCLYLAQLGLGKVAPNPQVGCVIVNSRGELLSEGYHQEFGKFHAEVIAIDHVKDKSAMAKATLYVNLEPCCHHGKTPPCVDKIIASRIKKVVIGCVDPSSKINGKGIKALKSAGCDVIVNILVRECKELNKRFFTSIEKKRPYIILKWAQTKDGFVRGQKKNQRKISSESADIIVHKWRAEEQAILVGTNTVREDNPRLTVRLCKGENPVRVVLDRQGGLPSGLHVFDNEATTIIFTELEKAINKSVFVKFDQNILPNIINELAERKIQSVIVEGGPKLINSFLESGFWDEARVIVNNKEFAGGIGAPALAQYPDEEYVLDNERILYYYN